MGSGEAQPLISAADMAKLLGRPLTANETANYDLYLNIAMERLESVLCTTVDEAVEERVYEGREDYSTVFTDIFTEVTSVQVNGNTVSPTKYNAKQWDRRTAPWFNSIVFDYPLDDCDEVTVNASYGFAELPDDLQDLIAKLFNLGGQMAKSDRRVTSKQIEDFKVTFNNDSTVYDDFLADNTIALQRYSLCGIGEVSHGRVRPFRIY